MKLLMKYNWDKGSAYLVDKDADEGVAIACFDLVDPPDEVTEVIKALNYVGVEVDEEDVLE